MSNRKKRSNNNKFFGLLIVLFGILLLIDRLLPTLDFLDWVFSLPMILIVIGLVMRARSGSNHTASWILISIGMVFLFADLVNWDIGQLIWPMIIIGVGLYIVAGKRRRRNLEAPYPEDPDPDGPVWDKRVYNGDRETETGQDPKEERTHFADTQEQPHQKRREPDPSEHDQDERQDKRSAQDYMESTSIFGNSRTFVVSKRFRGGDIVNIMGGSEINLMQADLQGPAVLEVVQLFGGTTIIAPAHWVVVPEMAAIFGGVEDKRYATAIPDKTKVLYLKGTSLFGGITIKSL